MTMSLDTTPVTAGEQPAARATPYPTTAYAWFVVGALSVSIARSVVSRGVT